MNTTHFSIIGIFLVIFANNIFYMEANGVTEYGISSDTTTFTAASISPIIRLAPPQPMIWDSFGNVISGSVMIGQQIQIVGQINNTQDKDQPFAYLVQIADNNGMTVSLSWITGTLAAGQSFKPAQSWIPTGTGIYTANIFVWQSIENPNALSPPTSVQINVV